VRRFALALLVACTARDAARPPVMARSPVPVATVAGDPTAPGFRLPAGVKPTRYELRLELDPGRDTFVGHVDITVAITAPIERVWLHAADLEITTASYRIDGRDRPLADDAQSVGDQMRGFSFGKALGHREVVLRFDYTGHIGSDEEGLFRERSGERWYLFSQSESMFARRILPCFDEPQLKATWHVTAVIPKGMVAIGNGDTLAARDLADGRREIEMRDVAGLPSYLLAIAVGPFQMVDAGTMGRRKIPVRVAVPTGQGTHAAVVGARLPAVVDALERYFDEPIPVAKIDFVAVPKFFGAMENTGLITFAAPQMLGDPRNAAFAGRFVRIAAHELAHQWLGNAVTPAWWDDLWLAEALANWMEEKIALEVGAFDDPPLRVALARERALAADDEIDAKPLRRKVVELDDAESAFDAISYDKGAALIHTFERWIGPDKLRDATRAYIRAHAGSTASSSDYTAALDGVAPGAGKALAAHLDRTGAPVVDLALSCDQRARITAHARTVPVPICVRTPAGTSCALVADTAEIALASCPPWVAGNAAGVGYYRVAGKLPVSLAALDPGEQLARGDDVAAAVTRGDVSVADAIRELAALARTRGSHAKLAAIAIARAIDPWIDDATAPRWAAWLSSLFADRLAPRTALEPSLAVDRELRDDLLDLVAIPPATSAYARKLLDVELAHLDLANAGWTGLALDVAAPAGDRALFDRVLDAARHTNREDLRDALLEGLGRFGPRFADRAVAAFAAGDLPTTEAWPMVHGYFERATTRAAAWRAVRDHVDAIFARLSGSDTARVLRDAASLCDPAIRADLAKTLTPRASGITDGAHTLEVALAELDRCTARRAKAGDIAALLR
jgi:alanyl aminopeptidase